MQLTQQLFVFERELDRPSPSYVEITMKAQNDMTVWSIIERLQRRLERQGLSPREADQAVAVALRTLAHR
jgi:hypothetical protein